MTSYQEIQIVTYMAAIKAIDAALKPTDEQISIARSRDLKVMRRRDDDIETARAAYWAWLAASAGVSRLLAKVVVGAAVSGDTYSADDFDGAMAKIDATQDFDIVSYAAAYIGGNSEGFTLYVPIYYPEI